MSAVPAGIKAGDRVRVVLEGEAVGDREIVFPAERNGQRGKSYYSLAHGVLPSAVSIEVLPPPAPEWSERDGAVVLDKWGCAWQYDDDKWRDVRHSFTPGVAPRTYVDLLETRGPLTLLHDPGAVA